MIAVAAEFAEVIFCAPLTIEQAQTFYRIIKARMTDHGRSLDEMKIMLELSAIVGRTAAEAQEKYEFLQSLIHPIVAREILSTVLGGVDLTPIRSTDRSPTICRCRMRAAARLTTCSISPAASISRSGRWRCGSLAPAARA
jgi:alkanesulfonate monooxygenase SsuD/methylene tetrahydromethanopterin reductase-like flavin-dependent oxidoreductase (luciferase family)